MSNINITNARNNLYQLAKNTIESHEPITFTSKSGDVVLVSKEDFDAMQETIYLQSNQGLSKEAKRSSQASRDDFVSRDELEW